MYCEHKIGVVSRVLSKISVNEKDYRERKRSVHTTDIRRIRNISEDEIRSSTRVAEKKYDLFGEKLDRV